MKLNHWAKLQTTSVLKKLTISIIMLIVPCLLSVLFWNQHKHIDSLYFANEKIILSSVQTGDLILLEKVLSTYRADPAVFAYKLADRDGDTLETFQKNEDSILMITRVIKIIGADKTNWGTFEVIWKPQFEFLIYFILGTIVIVALVGLVVFNSWKSFSSKLVESVEQMQTSLNKTNMPEFISEIDDLRNVFQQLQSYQSNLIATEKLRLQSEKEQALVSLSQQVAHDLRTPLSSLSLLLSPLKIEDERKSLLDQSMKRISEICDELLNTRKSALAINENLNFAITQVVNELRNVHSDKKIKLSFSDNVESLPLPDLNLKSVLSNLINNALGAISNEAGYVVVDVFTINNSIIIDIKDNGKGIPSNILSVMGNRPVTFGKGPEGNGLGFYNAKVWITKIGGELNIKSEINVGSEVRIQLPIQRY